MVLACDICGRECKSESGLATHTRAKHAEAPAEAEPASAEVNDDILDKYKDPCPVCGERVLSTKVHILYAHPEPAESSGGVPQIPISEPAPAVGVEVPGGDNAPAQPVANGRPLWHRLRGASRSEPDPGGYFVPKPLDGDYAALVFDPAWPEDRIGRFKPDELVPSLAIWTMLGKRTVILSRVAEAAPSNGAREAYISARGTFRPKRGSKAERKPVPLAPGFVYVTPDMPGIFGVGDAADGKLSTHKALWNRATDGDYKRDIVDIAPAEFGADMEMRPWGEYLSGLRMRKLAEVLKGLSIWLGLAMVGAIVLMMIFAIAGSDNEVIVVDAEAGGGSVQTEAGVLEGAGR